jgi:DHA1 family multidrug/chloramphenicol efflux transport protein-like MFS transporter
MVLLGLLSSLIICATSVVSSYFLPNFMLGIILTYILYAFSSGFVFAPLSRLSVEASNEPMGSRMAIFSLFVSGFATLATILVSLFYNGTLISLALMLFVLLLIATVIRLSQL